MKALLDWLTGFLLAAGVLGILLALLSVGGCATVDGVSMSDEDRANCRAEGCAAFTENEIQSLIRRAISEGYRRGWGAATRESAKGL